MALYGLYYKEKSERVYKLETFVPDEPIDKLEASSPVLARVNFVRKLKLSFKEFQNSYSVKKLASLDSLDIKQRESFELVAAIEDASVFPVYEKRSKIRQEEAVARNTETDIEKVNSNLPESYRNASSNLNSDNAFDVLQCKGCVQYSGGYCNLFAAPVNPVYVCNSFVRNNVKRIFPDTTSLEVQPTPNAAPSREDLLEENRLKNRSTTKDKFRTEEENRKRAQEKTNPFSPSTKFGPRKRIGLGPAPLRVDTQNTEQVGTQANTSVDVVPISTTSNPNTNNGGQSSY